MYLKRKRELSFDFYFPCQIWKRAEAYGALEKILTFQKVDYK